jgi:hypothetical protein
VNPVWKPVAGRAEVEAPDAYPLRAGELDGLLERVVEAPRPVAERLGVVVREAFDVRGLQARAFQRPDHA